MFPSKRPKEKREFHPRAHGAIYAIAAFYICTLIWELVKSYRAGGEGAPSLSFLVLGVAVLGGGAAVMAVFAWRMFRLPPVIGGDGEEEAGEGDDAGLPDDSQDP